MADPHPAKANIVISNPAIQRVQKRIATITIAVPAVATLAAVILAFWIPPSVTDLVVAAVLYALTTLGVTAGFHRLFAHRSYKAVAPLRAVLGVLGCMSAQGTLVYWVATHRRHHQYSEGDGDPHSPYTHEGKPLGKLRGLWHSHLGWMLESRMTNTAKFARDLIRDPLIARINDLYLVWVALGLAIPAAIGGLAVMSWTGVLTGLLWGGFVRMFLAHHAMWTSGSTAHIFGSRPFLTRDMSTNNALLALPNLGEAWHNNHHAFPSSAIFGLKWWQLDVGGMFIRACAAIGLASEVRRPTKAMIEEKKIRPETAGINAW
jgi:stearoyl-CoA desaturase (delta-9 desaturase)